MRILMPSRFVDRHVGGNTTYARNLEAGLLARGIAVGRIPAGSSPAATLVLESLAGLRKGADEDILHYVADTGPVLGTRRPTVVTVHGVASRWISVARRHGQERIWRMRVQRAIDAADRIITVSESSRQDVADVFGVELKRIKAIHHGIDVERFSRVTALSSEVREKLPDRFVLYLGNIEPRKNIIPLIEAFALPEVRALGLPLVIAGKPAWNADETLAAMELSPDVISLGFVSDSDRTALMQKSALFAFPSLYEGFGFPVLEAMAAGTPVLTSDRGSLAEIAGPATRLESLDPEGIAEGLVRALDDPTRAPDAVQTGREWAARFNWENSVSEHIDVYKQVSK
jgi:glycosyltransferase involved in cell wall biosynthesis